MGNGKLATIAAAVALVWIYFAKHPFSAYWLLAPVLIYFVLAVLHERIVRARTHAETAASFYRAGLARMDDRWAGAGASGERFRDQKHVYADDLDLFGRGCLFELLSTARLPMGENTLAGWLRFPSPTDAIVERQGLIAELRAKLELREDIAVTGEDLRARLNPESLTKWCEAAPVLRKRGLRGIAIAFSILAAATFVYSLYTAFYWPFLFTLLFELTPYGLFQKGAKAAISGVNCNAEGLVLFSQILHRLEQESFASSRLQSLVANLKRGPDPASRAVRKFARIVLWIDACGSLIVRILNLPLLYTIQTALVAEAWKKRYGHRMRVWIDIVGEMEALLSLAAYSFEHPDDPFPVFEKRENAGAFIAGEDLGHPLIPAAQCVRNNVRLDDSTRVLLVSGSNMSGKSTFLRTVGINAVLAATGAPIRGKSLRMTPLLLGTRLRSTDSLQEGRSTFYTELLRIRQVFDLAGGDTPVLFLFDELLDGTNSHDRGIGAHSIVKALIERGAIGILTTHDLALTEMAKSLGGLAHNSHFQDYVEDGKMRFDYKLRDGVVTKSNALELMRLVGLKV
jgi:MutS domain V